MKNIKIESKLNNMNPISTTSQWNYLRELRIKETLMNKEQQNELLNAYFNKKEEPKEKIYNYIDLSKYHRNKELLEKQNY